MEKPTLRQREILDYLLRHLEEECYWPSVREIQQRFGFRSTNAVARHLGALSRKGLLIKCPGQARSFRFPSAARSAATALPSGLLEIPVFGTVSAGYPDGVEPGDAVGRIQIDAQTFGVDRSRRPFALRVRGDSMIDAGILEGDTVILEKRPPRHQDIVAALIDGETTLKRFVHEKGQPPFLKAENANYPTLHPARELIIQGVARGMMRRFR